LKLESSNRARREPLIHENDECAEDTPLEMTDTRRRAALVHNQGPSTAGGVIPSP
jgi:hypothetical protein